MDKRAKRLKWYAPVFAVYAERIVGEDKSRLSAKCQRQTKIGAREPLAQSSTVDAC
jgi:hypothetical protein